MRWLDGITDLMDMSLLARDGVSREVPRSALKGETVPDSLTLCDPRDGSPPGSPVPEILQARTLEWVAISFSNADSPRAL